jgi:hypothetical protein
MRTGSVFCRRKQRVSKERYVAAGCLSVASEVTVVLLFTLAGNSDLGQILNSQFRLIRKYKFKQKYPTRNLSPKNKISRSCSSSYTIKDLSPLMKIPNTIRIQFCDKNLCSEDKVWNIYLLFDIPVVLTVFF